MPGPGGACREGGGLVPCFPEDGVKAGESCTRSAPRRTGEEGVEGGLGKLMAREGAVRTARGSPSLGRQVGVQQAAPLPCSCSPAF